MRAADPSDPASTTEAPADAADLLAVLARMAEGVLVAGGDGRIRRVNQRLVEQLALPARVAVPGVGLGALFRHLAGAFPVAAGLDRLERRLAGAAASDAEGDELRHLDGRVFEVRVSEIAGVGRLALFADISARRDAEAQLWIKEALLRETLDSVDGSIVVYDPECRYVLGNRRYHEIYPHLPPDEALAGRSFEEMLRLALAAGHVVDDRATRDPEGYVAERLADFRNHPERAAVQRALNGRHYLVRRRVTPSGNRVSLRVDVTEQTHAQEAMRRARDVTAAALALERAARDQQKQFVALVSHEIRAPLSIIDSTVQNIEIGAGEATADRQRLDKIRRAVRRMIGMLDTYLTEDRVGGERLALHPTRFDLAALLADLVESRRTTDPWARFRVECATLGGPIGADRELLAIALSNLLGNALEHAPPGGEVLLRGWRDGGRIEVAVTGGAADPAAASAGAGTAIGLALVRRIVEAHGGSVGVTAADGATTITVSLPDAPPETSAAS